MEKHIISFVFLVVVVTATVFRCSVTRADNARSASGTSCMSGVFRILLRWYESSGASASPLLARAFRQVRKYFLTMQAMVTTLFGVGVHVGTKPTSAQALPHAASCTASESDCIARAASAMAGFCVEGWSSACLSRRSAELHRQNPGNRAARSWRSPQTTRCQKVGGGANPLSPHAQGSPPSQAVANGFFINPGSGGHRGAVC